jgi:hypothetical protein
MQALLAPYGFSREQGTALEQRAGQKVVSAPLSRGRKLVIYTSMPLHSDKTRGKGADSIKVTVLTTDNRPCIRAASHVQRVYRWRENLVSRMAKVLTSLGD